MIVREAKQRCIRAARCFARAMISMMCDLNVMDDSGVISRSLMELQCGTIVLDSVKILEGFGWPIVSRKHLLGAINSCH